MGSQILGGVDVHLDCAELVACADVDVRGTGGYVVRINWCKRKEGGSVHASPVSGMHQTKGKRKATLTSGASGEFTSAEASQAFQRVRSKLGRILHSIPGTGKCWSSRLSRL